MIWTFLIFTTLTDFGFFFVMVRGHHFSFRNTYPHELCELYLLRHMMRDGHPLEFMYFGLERNEEHPRLLWPIITFFTALLYCVVGFVCAGIFEYTGLTSNEEVIHYFPLVFGSGYFVCHCLMIIPAIQNNMCYKEMLKMSDKEIIQIGLDIEKKWPGFLKRFRHVDK
jgi:hypothetical protein